MSQKKKITKRKQKEKVPEQELSSLAKEIRQKKVFDLRLKGISQESVADLLKISRKTVERDEFEIREKHRKWLIKARKSFDAESFWMGQIKQLEKVMFELWVIAADNDKDRVKALEVIERMQESIEKRMRAAGITTTTVEPDKMVTDTIRIIHENK